MSVYTHHGTGGDTLVKMQRGGEVIEVRADSIRHLCSNGDCSTLAATMKNRGMALADNTAPLRARTDICINEGCWDGYGKRRGEDSFAPGIKVHPAIRAAHRANVKARKADAKRAASAKVKAAAKKSTAAKKKSA